MPYGLSTGLRIRASRSILLDKTSSSLELQTPGRLATCRDLAAMQIVVSTSGVRLRLRPSCSSRDSSATLRRSFDVSMVVDHAPQHVDDAMLLMVQRVRECASPMAVPATLINGQDNGLIVIVYLAGTSNRVFGRRVCLGRCERGQDQAVTDRIGPSTESLDILRRPASTFTYRTLPHSHVRLLPLDDLRSE
jgi:hypothetical protein